MVSIEFAFMFILYYSCECDNPYQLYFSNKSMRKLTANNVGLTENLDKWCQFTCWFNPRNVRFVWNLQTKPTRKWTQNIVIWIWVAPNLINATFFLSTQTIFSSFSLLQLFLLMSSYVLSHDISFFSFISFVPVQVYSAHNIIKISTMILRKRWFWKIHLT